MSSYGDYQLQPNEHWEVAHSTQIGRVSDKTGKDQLPLGRLWSWLKGMTSPSVVLANLAKGLETATINNRDDAKAARSIRDSVEQMKNSYDSKTGRFVRFIDRTLHGGKVHQNAEQLIQHQYSELGKHFFGSDSKVVESLNSQSPELKYKAKQVIDQVYDTLTNPNLSKEDLKALDQIIYQTANKENDPAALEVFYKKLADKGWPGAQLRMAQLKESEGQSTSASGWYRNAAENGVVPAQVRLAKAHRAGELGVEKDAFEAHKWAVKAQGQSDEAWLLVAKDFVNGSGILGKEFDQTKLEEIDLSEANLRTGVDNLMAILDTSEDPGIRKEAHVLLGQIAERREDWQAAQKWYTGAGAKQLAENAEWKGLEAAHQKGDLEATFKLADTLERGRKEVKDLPRAKELFNALANNPDNPNPAEAMLRSAWLENDMPQTMTWLNKAVDKGSVTAAKEVLHADMEGLIPEDYPITGEQLQRAAKLGGGAFIDDAAQSAREETMTPTMAKDYLNHFQKCHLFDRLANSIQGSVATATKDQVSAAVLKLPPEDRARLEQFAVVAKAQGADDKDLLLNATRAFFADSVNPSAKQLGIAEILLAGIEEPKPLTITDPKRAKAWAAMELCKQDILSELEKKPEQEGIFRLSTQKERIDEFMTEFAEAGTSAERIKSMIEANKNIPNFEAALYKRLLREQDLVPDSMYLKFAEIKVPPENPTKEEIDQTIASLREQFATLDEETRLMLHDVYSFINKVSTYKSYTLMDEKNLAIVLAPNIFKAPGANDTEKAMVEMANTGVINGLNIFLMKHADAVFT